MTHKLWNDQKVRDYLVISVKSNSKNVISLILEWMMHETPDTK